MKIIIAGTFSPGRLELSYERALKELGAEVRRFNLSDITRFLGGFAEHMINRGLFNTYRALRPDLILIIKGYYVWPKTIRKIKKSNGPLIFCLNADNPFNLNSPGGSSQNILDSIPYYDGYFIWTRTLIDSLYKAGAKRVQWLPLGFDPLLHHPIDLSEEASPMYKSELVFVGNWDEERERWLKELVDFDLGIWGERYWSRRCQDRRLRSKWRGRAAYEKDASRVLSAAKISLNVLRTQNKNNHNMRTFEAPACGAFVLAERSQEATEFFQEDKEAAYFSTPQELKEKVLYYLRHDSLRRTIAQAGYQRCIESGYSYLDRAREILKNCEGG